MTVELKRNLAETTGEVDGFDAKRAKLQDEDGDESMNSENSDNEPNVGSIEMGSSLFNNNAKWQDTISKVVQSVVSIHFSQVAPFDSESAIVSEATGFVVDAKLGIILTNRHVVGPGPFIGYAIFDNHEECDVVPIYRDPVHDFGFLKFDPAKLKYIKVQALELKPSLAKVGSEIRVVGNDAGEKLSILAGFISRVDRNAPDYGELTYNDFNTEYIQAAAAASGGSSGSPVVNVDGYAVALQAGGSTEASTDFFLPLDRIVRALECIRQDKPITRGSIQTQWMLKPFDECRRLGLSEEREKEARKMFPGKTGLLVAETLLREGPAYQKLQEGDTLISINDVPISSFIQVDDILDSNVGNEITITVQRGTKDVSVKCVVGDLHGITPSRYVEVCGANFHELSYQMARFYALPVRGVFLASATGSFDLDPKEKTGWIIDSVDNKPTPTLDVFIDVMKTIPDESRVIVKFHNLTDVQTQRITSVYIDRHWCSEFRVYTRNDKTGIWDYEKITDRLPPVPIKTQKAKILDLPINGNEKLAKMSHSLCVVHSVIAITMDSMEPEPSSGCGLVIDAEKGYVIVSRSFVPHDCLNTFISFAESVLVPAKVIFLHPTQNYAIVQYNPALVDAPIHTPILADERLERGDETNFIGYMYSNTLVNSKTKVNGISSLSVPNDVIPRYRATNLEVISIDSSLSTKCKSGILADDDGTVRAIWLSCMGNKEKLYLMGLDVIDIKEVVDILKAGKKPKVSIVDAGFDSISLLQARIRGVPDEWIRKMEEESKNRLQFISVTRNSYTTVEEKLEPGDIILSVNGKLVKRMRDIGGVVASSEDSDIESVLSFKIVRDAKIMDLKIRTVQIEETSRIVVFAGCVLQAPHHAVRQMKTSIPSQVYTVSRGTSSLALQYGIEVTNFITHVNDQETPDLDTFLKVVKEIPDNSYCKMRLVTFDDVPFAISLKTNYHYFPTVELKKNLTTGSWIENDISET
ncbi:pro-apoptotic serine protease NMA111 [Kluyveromyces marxianus]|nr:pro-apoptotic serine protease NMA111 [Kluyveromyces marxianus]